VNLKEVILKNNMKWEIIINKDVPVDHEDMIHAYWALNNDVNFLAFVNKPTELSEKYNLTKHQINQLIKEYSICHITESECSICDRDLTRDLWSQTALKELIAQAKNRCNECQLKSLSKSSELITEYYNAKTAFESYDIETETRRDRFIDALFNQRWNELNFNELEALKGIVKYRDKGLIYRHVFDGDLNNQQLWSIVNKLEGMGLIDIERKYNKGPIVCFHFHDELPDILGVDFSYNPIPKPSPSISFSLAVNPSKHKG